MWHSASDRASLRLPAQESHHPPRSKTRKPFSQRRNGNQDRRLWPRDQAGLRWREEKVRSFINQ